MVTYDELIEEMVDYRNNLNSLMKKSVDANKVNVLGIRYESGTRIILEIMKAVEEERKLRELENQVLEIKAQK